MFREILRNSRGIALLVTLSIITLLVAVTVELNRKVRASAISTGASRDRLTLSYMASSGINAAMAMLVKDKMESTSDTVQEDWADPDKVSEVLRDIPFEEGTVMVKISDELSKIQLNALVIFPEGRVFNESQYNMWNRFLMSLITQDELLQETEPSMIINSAKDWLDSGDDDAITGLNGAESDYYQDLDPPYSCKNGRFTHIGELTLIRGITPDLFYSLGGLSEISSYMTVYGMTQTKTNKFTYEGKININTAELPVLAAILPIGNEDLAPEIYEYRIETSDLEYIHDLSGPTWYKNVPGCSDIEIDQNLIRTSSDIYRIESTATLHEIKITVTALVQREKDKKTGKWMCRILSWQAG